MRIAYKLNGKVVARTYLTNTSINFPHVVIDREILEPIESWVIENGLIIIDQEKLTAFNRSQLKTLTRRQFKLALLEYKVLDTLEQAIAGIEDHGLKSRIQIEYAEAEKFERNNTSVYVMLDLLDLTDEQIDAMWQHAATL